jgi:hypothetical protein
MPVQHKPDSGVLIMRYAIILCSTLSVWALYGCDDSDKRSEDTSQPTPGESCVPSETDWPTVKPIVQASCGLCHGEAPQFGAPYSLLNYSSLVAGEEGSRIIDTVISEVRMGDMPPVGQPALSASDQAQLLDWATCGTNTGAPPPGPLPGGFDVTRPIFESSDETPSTASVVEWRASGGTIGADEGDRYMCFSFNAPSSEDRLIRRFEPIIDDARVLHHIVLYEVESGPGDAALVDCGAGLSSAIYAWAPGQQALQFVDGGLRTGPERSYMVEIHYNNEAGLSDIADESGVRIYHEPLGATELDMLTVGPQGFLIPGNSRTEVTGSCPIQTELSIVASLPHMHEIGQSLKSTIIRADGTEEDLITLDGWDFNTQLFYDTAGLTVGPGDRITTRCIFENPDDTERVFGPYTLNEMCYNFLYVTPPPPDRYCDQLETDVTTYTPGECAPDGAAEVGEMVVSTFQEGVAPPATGGTMTPGFYRLTSQEIFFPSANLGPVTLDLERSVGEVAGVLEWTESGQYALDVSGVNHVITSTDMALDREIELSVSGTVDATDAEAGQFTLSMGCPNESNVTQSYSASSEGVTLRNEFATPAPGTILLHFERVD